MINKYWHNTYAPNCEEHGLLIRIYLLGIIAIICVNLILLVIIINRSAKGGITDTSSRWLVEPLVTMKIILILPETTLNVFATVWAFCGSIHCVPKEFYIKTVIECKFKEIQQQVLATILFLLFSHCCLELDRLWFNHFRFLDRLQSARSVKVSQSSRKWTN